MIINEVNDFYYIVCEGDTVSSLIENFKVSKMEFLQLNNYISDIEAGDVVFLPKRNNICYVVKPLDTLEKISKIFNVSVESIKEKNKCEKIFVGMRLFF